MTFIKQEATTVPGRGSRYDLYQTGCDTLTWRRESHYDLYQTGGDKLTWKSVTLLTVIKQACCTDLEKRVIIPAGVEGSEDFNDAVVFSDEDGVESSQPHEHVDTVVTCPPQHTQDRSMSLSVCLSVCLSLSLSLSVSLCLCLSLSLSRSRARVLSDWLSHKRCT